MSPTPSVRPEPLVLRRPPETSGGGRRPPNARQRTLLERGAMTGIREIYKKAGLDFNEAEDMPALQEARLNRPETPPFPILVFLMALMKDAADMILVFSDPSLSLVGATFGFTLFVATLARVLITMFTFIVGLTIWLWLLNKAIGGFRKLGTFGRMWVKRRIRQGAASSTLELIVPILPLASIYVFLAHHDENRAVQYFNEAAGKLANALKGKFGNGK
jgi:hypothetical protein